MANAPRWSPPQQARLDQWGVARSVDIHCHCLPGVDDGPAELEESLALCEALAADGITTVVATPHQLGAYDGYNAPAEIRAAVAELTKALAEAGIPLEIAPGGDVRIDERLPQLIAQDEVLTVADAGHYLLLELPHGLFVDPLPMIVALGESGVTTIMTHPERHRYLADAADRIESWVAAGEALQITAGSLLGDFGPLASQQGWRLVHAGLVSLIATDAHDAARRPPLLTPALEAVCKEIGDDAARTMCLDNPLRVFQGEPLPHVPGGAGR